jgi:Protein of unknown function (DUF5672)
LTGTAPETILSHKNVLKQGNFGSNFTIGNKVAAIIENRESENLISLILHFHTVLGPEWPIVLFTQLSPHNLSNSAPWTEGIRDGKFAVQSIPSRIGFNSHKAVSSFLTKPWFWEQLAPAEHVFFFQSDSIICANAPQHVDDYLQYDFIGAPIANGMGQGYNGGLSLRNRNKMLQIVRKHSWEEAWEGAMRRKAREGEAKRLADEAAAKEKEEKAKKEKEEKGEGKEDGKEEGQESSKRKRQEWIGDMPHTWRFPDNPTPPWEDYEDQWFFKMLTNLPRKWSSPFQHGANLPTEDVAKTFSVETVDYDRPLGYHQVGLILKEEEQLANVDKWCPEWRLCTDKRFANAG